MGAGVEVRGVPARAEHRVQARRAAEHPAVRFGRGPPQQSDLWGRVVVPVEHVACASSADDHDGMDVMTHRGPKGGVAPES